MSPPVASTVNSSAIAPTETADRQRELLGDAGERRRPAHSVVGDVGKGERVDAGELKRAEETADEEKAGHQQHRRRRREACGQHDEAAGNHGVDDEDVAEAEATQDRRGSKLHRDGADRRGEGDHPGFERRQTEAGLEEERQEEGRRADADPEEKRAENAGPQRRDAEEREIDDRVVDPPAPDRRRRQAGRRRRGAGSAHSPGERD